MRKNDLSNKDIEELKKNLKRELKIYNKFPSDIHLSVGEDMDHMEDIAQDKDLNNNRKVIRELVFSKLDKNCPINKDSIIYETTFLAGKEMVCSFVSNKLFPAVFLYYFVAIFTAIYCIYTLIK